MNDLSEGVGALRGAVKASPEAFRAPPDESQGAVNSIRGREAVMQDKVAAKMSRLMGGEALEAGEQSPKEESVDAEQAIAKQLSDKQSGVPSEASAQAQVHARPAVDTAFDDPALVEAEIDARTRYHNDRQALNLQRAALAEAANRVEQIQDPRERTRLKMILHEHNRKLNEWGRSLDQFGENINAARTARNNARNSRLIDAEVQKLNAAFPDLDAGKLNSYMLGVFTEREVASAYDSRLYTLAEKARRYDELTKNGTQTPPRTIKPTGKPIAKKTSEQKPAPNWKDPRGNLAKEAQLEAAFLKSVRR